MAQRAVERRMRVGPIAWASGAISRRRLLGQAAALLPGFWLGPWLGERVGPETSAGPGEPRVPRRPAEPAGAAQRDRLRIYIAPDDHTDYFWSAGEEAYRQAFLDTLDYYLDLADATAELPIEQQSRWNCDGWLWLRTYEQHRSPEAFARLIARIASGHVSVPLNALCICPGGAPAEALLRGMYYPGRIEREQGLRFRLAYLIENQTLPYGVAALFAGAGARYSWKGICGCDTRLPRAGEREREIYWWQGPDGSRLLMKWNTMAGGNQSLGGYAEARRPDEVVDYVSGDPDFLARYPYRVVGCFGQGWDDLETRSEAFVRTAREKTDAERQVIVSNEQDFFEDFEARYGADLPVHGASHGNEWDLYCAGLAEQTARIKRAVEAMRGAEAMAALASLAEPGFMTGREAEREEAWVALGLYWEHDFGMVGPPSGLIDARIAWQRRLADRVEGYVTRLGSDAAAWLGSAIPTAGASAPRYYVFNPLGFARSDVVDLPHADPATCHVIDLATGRELPSQSIAGRTREAPRQLRVLAEAVPALGYRVYEVRPGPGAGFTDAGRLDARSGTLQNAHWFVACGADGHIASLIDAEERQWMREIDGRRINDLGGRGEGVWMLAAAGPVSLTLRAQSASPLRRETRITLHRGLPRLEIENTIEEGFDTPQTWAFGFDIEAPTLWHEELGAVLNARLQRDGGHYADDNARYDWLTLNHLAALLEPSGAGILLSNADCCFMRLGRSTAERLDTETPQISVLAGGNVVFGDHGLPAQGGDTRFTQRFALQTTGPGTFDPAAAMRFALAHQNPLLAGRLEPMPDRASRLPAEPFSLLSEATPSTLLWALKPADAGPQAGLVARLWNLGDRPAADPIRCQVPLLGVSRLSHIETPIGPATVARGQLRATLAPREIASFGLELEGLTGTPPLETPTATPTGAPTATAPSTPTAAPTEPSATPTGTPTEPSTETPVDRLWLPRLLKR
ncbi:MAG: glycoside hydrolase [Chloroflexi bacterium]|nr:glycoside hydrolase [Chloroflexota bacterium]